MPREETAQSIIDCSGRLSDLVKRMAESEKSIHPSKVSIYTYESAATES
jgi:nitrogen-specific signal transduction histidine kinase